ncbi:MAG: VanZ family protein [Gemmatimonadales bacterium]|nr:MAG: VanZ family protein [Gemmatimonadales bacterium]
MPRLQRHLGYTIASAGLLLIGALTLLPTPGEAERAAATPLTCIICGDLGGVDFLLNILLFVPLGLGLALAGFSWRRAVVLAVITTCIIELLQMKVITGRDASLGDILANTIGSGLGVLLASYWRGIVLPSPRTARLLALLDAVILVGVWTGTAWGLGVSIPQGGRWFGALSPELGNFEQFRGRALSGTAGGEPLLPGAVLDQHRIEDAFNARPQLAFRAVLATPPPGLAPIAILIDDWHGIVSLIGQEHEDLVFGVQMRASILRLRNPTAVLPGGLAGHTGDTVAAEGTLQNGAFELRSRNGNHLLSRTIPLSASWGWSLVTPWNSRYDEYTRPLTTVWILGLVAVLAYWATLAGGIGWTILPVTIAAMLAAVPYAAGLPPSHWSEWVAAVAGITLGSVVAMTARRAIAQAEAAE